MINYMKTSMFLTKLMKHFFYCTLLSNTELVCNDTFQKNIQVCATRCLARWWRCLNTSLQMGQLWRLSPLGILSTPDLAENTLWWWWTVLMWATRSEVSRKDRLHLAHQFWPCSRRGERDGERRTWGVGRACAWVWRAWVWGRRALAWGWAWVWRKNRGALDQRDVLLGSVLTNNRGAWGKKEAGAGCGGWEKALLLSDKVSKALIGWWINELCLLMLAA